MRKAKIGTIGIAFILICVCLLFSNRAVAKGLQDYFDEGYKAYQKAHYKQALQSWKIGLELSEEQKHIRGQSMFLRNIVVIYANLGQYEKALLYAEKSLAIQRKIGDVKGEAGTLNLKFLLQLDPEIVISY